jgi:L-lactate dehydrogenase complex protein LldG
MIQPSFPAYQDPVAVFAKELEAVGGSFVDCRETGAIGRALGEVLGENELSEICWEDSGLFEKHGIPVEDSAGLGRLEGGLLISCHPGGGVEFPLNIEPHPYLREKLPELQVSVVSAVYGIAETGTVVESLAPGRGRALAVLPPVHVALLSESDLLMNHSDFFESVSPGQSGSAQILITGPSRTADIEKTLIIGVHGPRQLYVLLTR